jgi:hypothetical protein
MADRILSTDALAFFVGQDTLLKVLLSEEQSSRTPNLPRIQNLQRHRRHVQEQLNELSSIALHDMGIDTSRILKAELQVTLKDSKLEIAAELVMSSGDG